MPATSCRSSTAPFSARQRDPAHDHAHGEAPLADGAGADAHGGRDGAAVLHARACRSRWRDRLLARRLRSDGHDALARRTAQRHACCGGSSSSCWRLTVLLEPFVHLHPHFEIERLFGFHAWFGFAGLRRDDRWPPRRSACVLKRPDTYYDNEPPAMTELVVHPGPGADQRRAAAAVAARHRCAVPRCSLLPLVALVARLAGARTARPGSCASSATRSTPLQGDRLSRLFATIFALMAFGGGLFALGQTSRVEVAGRVVYAGARDRRGAGRRPASRCSSSGS